ncbi:MAG: hypothetical protein H0X50_05425 [Nitrosopumilus sp.]|nr:hypothetical protein [Nitrosopumilus sp.]
MSSDGNKYNRDKVKKHNKKGIILTLCIVIGIIGASFIIWFLPQGNEKNNTTNDTMMLFSNPNDTLASVNNQYTLLKDEVGNQLNSVSVTNKSNLAQIDNSVDASITQNNQLMQTLLNGNPTGSLVNEYVKLMNSLKNFSFYLSDIKNITSSPSSSDTLIKDLTAAENKWLGR